MSRAVYHEWYPQVWVDEHQMGTDGPRMFIPPFADPVDPDVHPLIWREANLVGTNMAFRLEQQEKAGLIYGYSFDAYWLGGTRNTGWWKNITGLLLETASARIASPIDDRAERAARRHERARRIQGDDQSSASVDGRHVADARHHGLRAHRLGRAARDRAPTAARICCATSPSARKRRRRVRRRTRRIASRTSSTTGRPRSSWPR